MNGLPIATMELKNRFTGQTVADAVEHYKTSRSPQEDLFRLGRCAVHFAVDDEEVKFCTETSREDLFRLGRCAVHFAVDDEEVKFCTELKGKASDFLPFNKGRDDGGAGNPPNPDGMKTAYLGVVQDLHGLLEAQGFQVLTGLFQGDYRAPPMAASSYSSRERRSTSPAGTCTATAS